MESLCSLVINWIGLQKANILILILFISIFSAALPVGLYVLFVWWMDRYEREPLWLVFLTFLWGAIGGVFFAFVGSLVLSQIMSPFTGDYQSVLDIVLVAPVIEEPSKIAILFVLLLSREFDNTTDGIVYGATVGLGFSMTENFFYFIGGYMESGVQGFINLIILRTLFSAVMHSCASATFGACIGFFRYRHWSLQWMLGPLLGFILGTMIHGAYNGALVWGESTDNPLISVGGLVLVPVLCAIMIALTQLSLYREHRLLREELEEEAVNGVLPLAHANIIPFALKRRKKGWVDRTVDRDTYVRVATLLAFRKRQSRLTNDPSFVREVHELRRRIRQLLSPL